MLKFIFAFFYLGATFSYAQDAASNDQTKSEFIDYKKVITEIPKTSWMSLQRSFSRESIPDWAAIIGSTAILYHNDEVILKDVQRSGRDLGVGNDDNTKSILSLGDIDIIRLPTDAGSFMYFLGDGWMHGSIAAGFLANGYFNHNSRAFNTGLQLGHGMIVSTMFNQFLKRSFGRESPYVKSEPYGRWSPYPSVPEYQQHTSRYDGMPSGHVMTTTMVFTIINENYPEYSYFIVPLGVTWTSVLAWEMVNNGVHWAADYPLGIAMGFVFGHAATRLGKTEEEQKKDPRNWTIMPTANRDGSGLTFLYSY
jgi:hypothetical protein